MTVTNGSLRNHAKDIIRLLCAACILVMLCISFAVYKAPAGQLAALAVFFVLYVQLPGMLLLRLMLPESGRLRYSTALALGMFAGWALCIAEYFITELIGTDVILYAAGPLMSAAFAIETVKDRKRGSLKAKGFSFRRLQPALCIFITLITLYCLVNTQYRYLAPEVSDFVYVNPDKAYHMGIINALSHGYPLESPWVLGKRMHYHIFTEMLFCIPVRLFHIEADVVSQSFAPLFTVYCFGTSMYSFFREMTGKPERAGIYSLCFFLALMYPARRITSSYAYKLILTNDNYAGYGLAAMLMAIVVFGMWYRTKSGRGRTQLLILCTALIMLTTGIKGPIGAVVIAAMWGTVLLGMILRKMPVKTLLPLMVMTAGFLVIYVFLIGGWGQTDSPQAATLKLAGIVNISFWKEPLTALMKSAGIPKLIRLGVILAVFTVLFFTAFFVPFCIGYVRELILVLSGRKPYEPARVLVYAVCLTGFAAMMLLSYSGHSQVYFGLTAIVLAPAVAFWFIEDMEEAGAKGDRSAKTALRVTAVIMAASFIVSGTALCSYFSRRIGEAAELADPAKEQSRYMSISRSEYEAMRWIENNTERDAVLANDRWFSTSPEKYSLENRWDNRFFLYEVYSNRPSYISGSGFDLEKEEIPLRKERIENTVKLTDEDFEGRGDLARDIGVDYVIVSKRFNDAGDLSNDDYELCFSNEDVDIYRVNGI